MNLQIFIQLAALLSNTAMQQTPPLLLNLLFSSPPLLFSQLVSCDICSAATWISSCQRWGDGGREEGERERRGVGWKAIEDNVGEKQVG